MLLVFLWGVGALAARNDSAQQSPPLPLLLVSFDGFRADYLQRFPMPNLKLLYSQGVLVDELTNVFITKTFPNHYSLVSRFQNVLTEPCKKNKFSTICQIHLQNSSYIGILCSDKTKHCLKLFNAYKSKVWN